MVQPEIRVPVARLPAGDLGGGAPAAGLGALGAAAQRLGVQLQTARRNRELSRGQVDLAAQISEAARAAQQVTDPEQSRTQFAGQLETIRETAAGYSKDPHVAEQLGLYFDQLSLSARHSVEDTALRREVDRGRAELGTSLDDLAHLSASAGNDAQRAELLATAGGAVDRAVEAGFVSQVEAGELSRGFGRNQQQLYADRLVAEDPGRFLDRAGAGEFGAIDPRELERYRSTAAQNYIAGESDPMRQRELIEDPALPLTELERTAWRERNRAETFRTAQDQLAAADPFERVALARELPGLSDNQRAVLVDQDQRQAVTAADNELAELPPATRLERIKSYKAQGIYDATAAESRRRRAIADHRKDRVDQIIIDVRQDTQGRNLGAVIAELNAARDKWETDHDALDAITIDEYDQAIARIVTTRASATAFDISREMLGDRTRRLAAGERDIAPMPPGASTDNAIGAELLDRGAAVGGATAGGDFVLDRITHPEAAAAVMDAAGGVLGDWTGQLRRRFAAGDTANMEQGGRELLALHRQRPDLAVAVIGGMSEQAQLRAQAFLDFADDVGGVPPLGDGETGYVDGLKRTAARVADLRLVDVPLADVQAALWGEAAATWTVRNSIDTELRDHLPEGLQPRTAVGAWMDGVENLDFAGVAPEVRAFYQSEVIKAYRQVVSEGRGIDAATAAIEAKKLAADRTYVAFPPLVWDGDVILQPGNAYRTFEADVRVLLGRLKKQSPDAYPDSVDTYIRNYRPRWSEQGQGWDLVKRGSVDSVLPDVFIRPRSIEAWSVERSIEEAKKYAASLNDPDAYKNQLKLMPDGDFIKK